MTGATKIVKLHIATPQAAAALMSGAGYELHCGERVEFDVHVTPGIPDPVPSCAAKMVDPQQRSACVYRLPTWLNYAVVRIFRTKSPSPGGFSGFKQIPTGKPQ